MLLEKVINYFEGADIRSIGPFTRPMDYIKVVYIIFPVFYILGISIGVFILYWLSKKHRTNTCIFTFISDCWSHNIYSYSS